MDDFGVLQRCWSGPDAPADDSVVTFAYDSLGRVIEETQRIGVLAPEVVSSAWRAENLRSALTYEQEVLDDLMDPSGFMAMTHKALFEQWKTATIESAMKQLTGGKTNG